VNPRAKVFESSSGDNNFSELGINILDNEETERELVTLKQKGLEFSD